MMVVSIPDEQAALLAAIVANPDDDTARLVYADWLQENGDEEQAQYIRDSIKMEWLHIQQDEDRQQISNRLEGVAEQNGKCWLEAIGVMHAEPIFDRGLPDAVIYSDVSSFRQDAIALFARVPVVDVTINGLIDIADQDSDSLYPLATMPELKRLNSLHLTNSSWPVTLRGWEQFITSPNLSNLRVLSVQFAGLTDEYMLWFEVSQNLTYLEELGLGGNQLSASGARAVVQSRFLPNLRRLGLGGNLIGEDRRRGSSWLELRDALLDRFGTLAALDTYV